MKKLILAAVFTLITSAAHAGMPTAELYLSTSGTDSGNCQVAACRTPPYAAAQVPPGYIAEINVADGSYTFSGTARTYYYSPVSWIGNLAHPENIVFQKTDSAGCVLYFEDDSIGGVQGISFYAGVAGQTAICSRQHTIVDFLSLRFGGGPIVLQQLISSTDYGVNSCTGTIYIDQSIENGAAAFMLNNSKLNLNCAIVLPAGLTIPFFVEGVGGSRINLTGSFTGGGQGTATHGLPYNIDGLTLLTKNGVILPGDLTPAVTNGSVAY